MVTLPRQYATPMVSRATTKVEPPLKIGFTSTSPASVNLRKPTALSTISTDAVARTNPKAQAIVPIANTSITIILPRVFSVPPITLWMETSLLRCSSDRTRPYARTTKERATIGITKI